MVTQTDSDPDGAGPLESPINRFTYDPVGNLESATDPLGRVSQYDYDSLNRRVANQDPRGGRTTFTYDAAGNLLSLTDPVANTNVLGLRLASSPNNRNQ